MFGEHVPRLWKALIVTSFGALVSCLSTLITNETVFWIVFIGGFVMAAIGLVEAFFVNYAYIVGARERHYNIQIQVIEALSKADPDVRNAIGLFFPQYNFMYTDRAILCWHNTEVPMDIFREFMKGSNTQYTVAERDWKARGVTYHRNWNVIYSKLVDLGFVVPDSSAGNHSQMWRGNSYSRSWEMWMTSSMNLQELKD